MYQKVSNFQLAEQFSGSHNNRRLPIRCKLFDRVVHKKFFNFIFLFFLKIIGGECL